MFVWQLRIYLTISRLNLEILNLWGLIECLHQLAEHWLNFSGFIRGGGWWFNYSWIGMSGIRPFDLHLGWPYLGLELHFFAILLFNLLSFLHQCIRRPHLEVIVRWVIELCACNLLVDLQIYIIRRALGRHLYLTWLLFSWQCILAVCASHYSIRRRTIKYK